jgi:hypothetical protein
MDLAASEPIWPTPHRVEHSSSVLQPAGDPLIHVGRRRWCLQVGMAALGGLFVPEILCRRARTAQRGAPAEPRAVIQIWLSGAPSQIDMWDPKPLAPREIRGPFESIPTAIPGVRLSEHMPRQAALMEKLAIVRSMDASGSSHWPVTIQAGSRKATQNNGAYPAIGSLAARFRGPNRPDVPAFVGFAGGTHPLWYDVYGSGQLGSDYEPVDGGRVAGRFSLPEGIAVPRLMDRHELRQDFDRLRSRLDLSPEFARQERSTQAAYELVLGGAAERAFDLSREPDASRERYGRDSLGEKALLARRLVEAGVTYVVLSDRIGSWDHHGDEVPQKGIERGLRPMLPRTDQVVATLVEDLEQRGLLDSTLVVVVGEFGRAPVMTKTGGRDHWFLVMSLLLAGGGLRMGQVIGETDSRGGEISQCPLGPGDLAATILKHLGIDPFDHWINPAGRPMPLVEAGQPIAQLF